MTYASLVSGFATGLSTVGYEVFTFPAGTVYAARTTAGVTAIGKSYGVSVTLPDNVDYVIQWDDGGSPANYAPPDLVSPRQIDPTQLMGAPRALDSVADSAVTINDVLWAGYAGGVGQKDASSGSTETVKTASTGTLVRTYTVGTSSTNPFGNNFPVRVL
jgi:hypothetical protein